MRSRRRLCLVVIVLVVTAVAFPDAAEIGLLKRDSKTEYRTFRDPNGRFALDYPKDWQVIAGAGDVLVTFAATNGEAAFVVERSKMNIALAPEDITDLFAQIEADILKERQPRASDLIAKVGGDTSLRTILIDYARPGLSRPERARQYSLPMGQELYRLTCSALTIKFAKYDSAFAHVAGSFKNTAAPQPGMSQH